MSFSIDQAFVNQYNDNVLLLSQQFKSRLAEHVTLKSGIVGEAAAVERLAQTEAFVSTTRHEDTPFVDITHDRRWLFATVRKWATLIDKEDEVRMLISPSSSYVRSGVAAMERAKDAVIVAAALGTAYAGHTIGSSTVVLPAGSQIGNGSAALTLAKITKAQELMNIAEVPPEGRVIVVGGQQVTNMMNDSTISSALYNDVRILMANQIHEFAGFTWIRYERLPKASTIRSCVAFHPMYLSLGIFQDTQSRIAERPDKSYATNVYMWNVLGAVRLQESAVVQIDCVES